MKNQLDALLSKQMTRKEFLQHVGAALLILLGISQLLHALQTKPQGRSQTAGYGASAYGGVAKR